MTENTFENGAANTNCCLCSVFHCHWIHKSCLFRRCSRSLFTSSSTFFLLHKPFIISPILYQYSQIQGNLYYAYSTDPIDLPYHIGCWVSSDGGATWTVVGDALPNLASWATKGGIYGKSIYFRGRNNLGSFCF